MQLKSKIFEITIDNLGYVKYEVLNEETFMCVLNSLDYQYSLYGEIDQDQLSDEITDCEEDRFKTIMAFVTYNVLTETKSEFMPKFGDDWSVKILKQDNFLDDLSIELKYF